MEAVGRLAGGIAHDFNNMLMAIVGYASLGRELAAEGSKLRYYNDQVLAAADKATDLTRQILAFSRKQVMSPAPVDLNGIILGMGKIIARLLGEDIEISLNLAGSRARGPGRPRPDRAGADEPVHERPRRDARRRAAGHRHPGGRLRPARAPRRTASS